MHKTKKGEKINKGQKREAECRRGRTLEELLLVGKLDYIRVVFNHPAQFFNFLAECHLSEEEEEKKYAGTVNH